MNPSRGKASISYAQELTIVTIWQECCDDYINPAWERYSIEFLELHTKLSVSMCLSLLDTAKEMLPETAMKIIKDPQALFN